MSECLYPTAAHVCSLAPSRPQTHPGGAFSAARTLLGSENVTRAVRNLGLQVRERRPWSWGPSLAMHLVSEVVLRPQPRSQHEMWTLPPLPGVTARARVTWLPLTP